MAAEFDEEGIAERTAKLARQHCLCCDKQTAPGGWDYLYSSCHGCAHCASLEHFEPCHHGECMNDSSSGR